MVYFEAKDTLLLYINLFVVVAVPLFIKGFLRHRHTWTARAWRTFAGAFVLSLVPFSAGLMLTQRIDMHASFRDMTMTEELSAVALIPLCMFALLAPVFLLSWFATSEAARHLDRRLSSRGHSPNTS